MTTPATPRALARDEIETDDTHYGIPLALLAEGCDEWIGLGHHRPRHFLAACNRHARINWQLPNLTSDPSVTNEEVEELLERVEQRWAVFHRPQPGFENVDGFEDPNCAWYLRFANEGDEDALPVTWLDFAGLDFT